MFSASRTMTTILVVPVAVCGLAAADRQNTNPAAAALASHIMVTPDDVKWEPCPPALPGGAQCAVLEGDLTAPDRLFAFRVKVPSGYKIPPHFHPADEHLVVLQGTFHIGMGEVLDTAKTKPLVAGSFAVMPKGARHFAWTQGETIVQVYAIGPWGLTYVNASDDPRNQKKTNP